MWGQGTPGAQGAAPAWPCCPQYHSQPSTGYHASNRVWGRARARSDMCLAPPRPREAAEGNCQEVTPSAPVPATPHQAAGSHLHPPAEQVLLPAGAAGSWEPQQLFTCSLTVPALTLMESA